MTPLHLTTIIAFLLLLWAIVIYNRFIRLSRLVDEAWSGIAVQLCRRHDLIPNLVNTVKGYATHEKTLLEEITRLRGTAVAAHAAAPTRELLRSEGQLSASLDRLFIITENYPELLANENFMSLHRALQEVEDHLQMARRYYNGTVRNHAIQVDSFPSLLIARLFNFRSRPFFELRNEAEGAVPEVHL